MNPETKLPLRSYQKECIENILKNYSNNKNRLIINLPVASGKTVIFSHLISQFRKPDYQVLVLAHTNELLEQAKNKIQMIIPGASVGIVNQDSKEFDKDIIVCSIQSACRDNNLVELCKRNIKLVICDEAHHYATKTARKVLDALGFGKDIAKDKLLCGFTATPFRNKSEYGLGEVFTEITFERTIQQMIEDKWLVPPRAIKIMNDLDLSLVETSENDFNAPSLAKILDTPDMVQKAIDAYLKDAKGRKAIAFGCTVQHAMNLANCFMAHGIKAATVYGDMHKDERSKILKQYADGEIDVITNCAVLTEGFDAPQTDCIIIARPTKSAILFTQIIGRGLRLFPNKVDSIILDFGSEMHEVLNLAVLLDDAVTIKQVKEEKEVKAFMDDLPKDLNQNLKAAIARCNFDPLNVVFKWKKIGMGYWLKGINCTLKVMPDNERWAVILFKTNLPRKDHFSPDSSVEYVTKGLSFEYAFPYADNWATENRKLFILSDKEAAWRKLPISEGQIKALNNKRFRAGLDKLTRGQAATILDFLFEQSA